MTATAVGTITAVLLDWDGTLIDSRAALLAAWHESTDEVLGRRFPATAAEEREVFMLPGSAIWQRLASSTTAVGVLWGACTADELHEAGASAVLAQPQDLVALILRGEA